MCIILVKPANAVVTKNTLKTCWENNSDGAGFMLNANGQVEVHRGFFTFKSFYKAYRREEQVYSDSTFVVHMRVATSGNKNLVNCHPFPINEHLGMAHNGVLPEFTDYTSDYSDTFHFVNTAVSQWPSDFLNNDGAITLLEEYCGQSKLVFLDHHGKTTIINKNLGEIKEGVWYSNNTYCSTRFGFASYGYSSRNNWDNDKYCWPVGKLQLRCDWCNTWVMSKQLQKAYWNSETVQLCPTCFQRRIQLLCNEHNVGQKLLTGGR